jgi:hypothetical protein
VYLLGAGFSRAVSDKMPMMAELSTAIKDELRDRDIPGADTPVSSNFEQWLSFLVERPPWLSTADQERNQAGFFAVSEALHRILSERQGQAVDAQHEKAPAWLQRLVRHWQHSSSTVITFNYDNLLELAWRLYAAAGAERPDGWIEARMWTDLYPFPVPLVTRRFSMPPGHGLPQTVGMKLLKLHGSLTWRYERPSGGPGGLIYETWGLGECKWNAKSLTSAWPPAYWADLEPMIVPPAAVKSPYYSNAALQANWKLAAEALSNAGELVVMGFSLPQTDLLVSSMLATTLRDDVRITPVNPGMEIVDRLEEVLEIPASTGRVSRTFTGRADPIRAWVEETIDPAT